MLDLWGWESVVCAGDGEGEEKLKKERVIEKHAVGGQAGLHSMFSVSTIFTSGVLLW